MMGVTTAMAGAISTEANSDGEIVAHVVLTLSARLGLADSAMIASALTSTF